MKTLRSVLYLKRATVLLILSCLSAAAAEPFQYGYISTNVDCKEPGKPPRMKFVSQTFAFCPAEVSGSRIIQDTKIFLHQLVKSSCGENYSVSFSYVDVRDTESQAERDRQQSLREAGYGEHVEWHASVDYYSSKCR